MVHSYDNPEKAERERERAALIIEFHELMERRKGLEEELRQNYELEELLRKEARNLHLEL